MKVVTPRQMSAMESNAYRDGSQESDFMEEAGSGVALVVHDYAEHHDLDRYIILLCGKGNNAGDAYVAGVHLLHLDYEVVALQVVPIESCSPLCKINYQRFLNEGGHLAPQELAQLPKKGIVVDGLFGTGFRGVVGEPFDEVVRWANNSRLPIIAVDIPSGLNGETGIAEGGDEKVIVATETVFLGLPKRGFFFNNGWDHVGKLRYIDFGLPKEYIEECETDLTMLSKDIVEPLLPKIKRSRHKYETGYVVGLAGSPGMPGAALLASTAAYRGGAGIVRLLHPEGMQAELSSSPYELIRVPYHSGNSKPVVEWLNKASATFIGPGIGTSDATRKLIREILPQLTKPCVIDAEALTILADEEVPFPENTIITPHHGEMGRLLKMSERPILNQEFLNRCLEYSSIKNVTLVLKGGPTFILHGGTHVFVNPTGDPGMATAGSGDVLTGLLAALLAQKLPPLHAAQLGVYLHGLAGEHAADELTSYSVMASDITFHLTEALRFFEV